MDGSQPNISAHNIPTTVINTSGEENDWRIKRYKIWKTVFMINIWICLGLWGNIVTPCIDVLKDSVHCNYEDISKALASRSVGIMVGSICGGYLTDKFQRWVDVIIGLSLLFSSIAVAAVPWTPNIPIMATSFVVMGLSQGAISAAGNNHAVLMWGKDSTGPIHFVHAGYGIGTVVGPLFVAPFLPSQKTNHNGTKSDSSYHQIFHHNSNTLTTGSLTMEHSFYLPFIPTKLSDNSHTNSNTTGIDVTIPFAITGGFTALISLIFFIYAFFPFKNYQTINISDLHNEPQRRRNFKEIISPGSCAQGDTFYALQMFTMIFIFYVLLVGKDLSLTVFMQPVAVHTPTLQFTLREADILIAVYFTCYTSGRILMSVVGKWVSVKVMIFIESIGILITQLLLVLIGLDSKLTYWLTACAYGLFTGPLFPTGMAWSDRYLQMTAVAFAVLDIGIGSGVFIFNWLCGYLLNKYPENPVVLNYIGLSCAIAAMVLLIIMQVRGSLHGDRHTQATLALEVSDNDTEGSDEGHRCDIDPDSPLIIQ